MSWQSYLTSQFQLIFLTEGTKYNSQASHLVRPDHSFSLYANIRIRNLCNNSRIFNKRLNFLWFLNLVFFIVFLFFYFYFYYFCIINFTITILSPLLLFLPSSLSHQFLCYNPLFSLPTTLSSPSQLFPLSSPSSPILPQPVTKLPLTPTH
jgi:hypothetical protein